MANQVSFCHVFLSFRGETRNKFTCFLYEALKADGFEAFMDKTDVHIGDELDFTIQQGIKSSMSAIIIFSQNYAYSTWCLDELVLIVERYKKSRYFILPIFYEVQPRDIKHQLGNYGLALERHRARHNHKVDKWREALSEVGNILGDHVEGLQNIFIQNTVKLFREKMGSYFPECRLPMPNNSILQGNPSASSSSTRPKVVLYTTNFREGPYGNGLIRNYLMLGDIVYEERNCSKEPMYVRELEEIVGKNRVRFPTVTVNGKDLCGGEEVEGLDNFQEKGDVIAMLKLFYVTESFYSF